MTFIGKHVLVRNSILKFKVAGFRKLNMPYMQCWVVRLLEKNVQRFIRDFERIGDSVHVCFAKRTRQDS